MKIFSCNHHILVLKIAAFIIGVDHMQVSEMQFQLNNHVGDCLGRFLSIHSSRKLQFLHNIHTFPHLITVLSEYGLVIYGGSYLKIIYIGHAQLVFFWVSALCHGRKFHLNHIRSPWKWSQYIPLKCQNLQPLSGAETQKRPATDQQPLWKPKN